MFPSCATCTFFVWLYLLTVSVAAQPARPGQVASELPIPTTKLPADNLDLRPFTQFWSDTASRATYTTVDQLAKLSPFPAGPLRAYGRQPTIWLRFLIRNPHPTDTLHRLFFGGYHLSWVLGQSDMQNRMAAPQDNGWLIGPPAQGSADPFTLPVKVLPGQTATVWFQTTGYIFYSAITPRLFTPAGYAQFLQARVASQRNHFGYCCLIMGICLFLSMFAGVQAVYALDATYGYWSLYLAATFLFFLLTADLGFDLQIAGPTIAAFIIPTQYLIVIAYLLFLRSFLQLNQYMPHLNRLILIAVYCLAIICGVSYWCNLTLAIPIIKLTDQAFVVTEILLLFALVAIVRARVPNRNLFIIGSLGLVVMAGLGTILNELGQTDFDYFWTDPTVWYGVGVVFELTFFNLALSQRARLAERGKQQLEYEKALENQRVQRITDQFQQRIAETEMAGLRSQMNPHFIFNCLNSIQYFTAQNDAEKASDYLSKFSRLIRLVLENSKSEKVTLANELETLRLYIDLEAMRFPQKLHYAIDVADTIDTDRIQIPPLLLQPFVENAIWHGLMHKDEGGTVRVVVLQPRNDLLRVAITDDGIGRQKAADYKSKSATKQKSFGMKMTVERIDLINQLYHSQTMVQVEDLINEQGMATGTKVLVNIPI
ncbi:sensor histidine kinase [Spirosoma areae]